MPESSKNVNSEAEDKSVYALINTVRGKDMYGAITKAMGDMSNFLGHFNGPFALNAVTTGATERTVIDEFTKDGIKILSHLSANRPEDELSRRLIEFIGERVDSRCHDGTTTSMMTAATLSYNWMNQLAPRSRRERHQAAKIIPAFVDKMKEAIDANSFTVDEFVEAIKQKHPDADEDAIRRRIYYDTIMTSSKGDKELAEKLSEVLVSLPPELYNYTRFESSAIETDERFAVITQDSDVELKGQYIGNYSQLKGNVDMGTTFSMDKAYIVISAYDLMDGQMEAAMLEQWIGNALLPGTERRPSPTDPTKMEEVEVPPAVTLDRPLIILARTVQSKLTRMINIYNAEQPDWNKKIFMFAYRAEHDLSYDAWAKAIPAMAGDHDQQYHPLEYALTEGGMEDVMIPCKFWATGNQIKIGDLYKKDNRRFHPFYYGKENKAYWSLIDDMASTIKKTERRHLDPGQHHERFLIDLIYIQRCMLCQDVKEMRVCSTTHELFANNTVVEDALGSAMSVMEEGFVLSGYQKMLKAFYESAKESAGDDTIEGLIGQATVTALETVLKASYDLDDETFAKVKDTLTFGDVKEDLKFLFNNAFDDLPFPAHDSRDTLVTDGSTTAVFQARAGYLELFIRVKDIIAKLVMTYSLLTGRTFDKTIGR